MTLSEQIEAVVREALPCMYEPLRPPLADLVAEHGCGEQQHQTGCPAALRSRVGEVCCRAANLAVEAAACIASQHHQPDRNERGWAKDTIEAIMNEERGERIASESIVKKIRALAITEEIVDAR